MASSSFWSWSGWGAVEALATLAAAIVALTVYASEVKRRRRAERNSVRIRGAKESGATVIYIVNDSHVPIVETRIIALYQGAAGIAPLRLGITWSVMTEMATLPRQAPY